MHGTYTVHNDKKFQTLSGVDHFSNERVKSSTLQLLLLTVVRLNLWIGFGDTHFCLIGTGL